MNLHPEKLENVLFHLVYSGSPHRPIQDKLKKCETLNKKLHLQSLETLSIYNMIAERPYHPFHVFIIRCGLHQTIPIENLFERFRQDTFIRL